MKVSIITATYNSAATVGDTLKSVASQDYPDIEHIIVDGASKDATADVVHRYASCYPETIALRWHSEPDKGIYDAMNKGIARATGDVIGILNSDDFFASNDVVSRLVAALEARGNEGESVDAVYADVMYVDADDTSRFVRFYSSRGFRRWKMLFGYMPAHPTFYCRREVYGRFGAFDISFRVAADFENLLRLIWKGCIKTRYVPMTCVRMRIGGASSSGLASHRQILRDHARAYRKNSVPSNAFLDSLRYIPKVLSLIRFRLFGR